MTSKSPPDSLASDEDSGVLALLRAVAHAPPRPPPPQVVNGTAWGASSRYVIERRLGRGGMGTVYAAQDTLLDRLVALKVLDAVDAVDEETHRTLLLREAQLAARVEHERVARVYDVGEHQQSLFVAMEFVRGTTLRRWMLRDAIGPQEVIAIARQIAEGLAALHESGVIHRDLKPENVMLTAQGAVKLLDFGLARTATRPLDGTHPMPAQPSQASGLSGTPGYMAPEQCVGGPVDARADVYALGVIIHELVTSRRPFSGDALEVIDATLAETPSFDDEEWVSAPPRLLATTKKMLARAPAQRYAGGAEALRAICEIGLEGPAKLERSIDEPVRTSAAVVADAPVVATTLGSKDDNEHAKLLVPRRLASRTLGLLAAFGIASALSVLGMHWLRRVPAVALPEPPGMARVQGGDIVVGRSVQELDRECAAIGKGCDRELMMREAPAKRVTVAPFVIDRYEVTNEEMAATLNTLINEVRELPDEEENYPRYVRWRAATGQEEQFLLDLHPDFGGVVYKPGNPGHFEARAGRERFPVTQVTFYGARLFCTSRGKRLPTEDEWEAAARGSDDRHWPWGNDPVRCGGVIIPRDGLVPIDPACPAEVEMAPVGQAAQDVTPEGVHDLAGNVSEWVDTAYVEGNRAAVVEDKGDQLPKVLRGGSFADSLFARTSGRNRRLAISMGVNVGFRCASHPASDPTM